MSVTTVAVYECHPGDRDAVLSMLEPARLATIAEDGCAYFHVLLPERFPDRIVLIEGWRTLEDLSAHRETAHFTEIVLGAVAPRLRHRSVDICEELASAAVAGSE